MKKHFLEIVSFRVKKFHKHSKRTFFELMINFDWKLLKKVPCVRKSISFELKRVLFLGKVFFFRWKSSSFTYKGSPFELNNFFLGKDAFSDKNVPRLLFPLPWRQYLCLWKFYFQMKTFRVYLNRIPFEVIFFFTFSDEAFQGLLWKALSWDEKEIDWKSFIFRWKSSVVTLKGPLTKT